MHIPLSQEYKLSKYSLEKFQSSVEIDQHVYSHIHMYILRKSFAQCSNYTDKRTYK